MHRTLIFALSVCLLVGISAVAVGMPYDAQIPAEAEVRAIPPDQEHPGPREQYYIGQVLVAEREWYEGGTALYHELVFPIDEQTGKRCSFAVHRMYDRQGKHLSIATEYNGGCTGPTQRWYEDGTEEFVYLAQGHTVSQQQYTQLWQQDQEMPPPDLFLHLAILPRPGAPAQNILPRGASGAATGQMSLPPLTWPKLSGETDTTPPTAPAEVAISSSPLGEFSKVGVAPRIAFGAVALTARLSTAGLNPGTEIATTWRYNDGAAPLSSATASLQPNMAYFDNTIINTTGPLAPGAYSVTLSVAGQVVGRGQVHIEAAAGLGGQSAEQVYMTGLQAAQRALTALDAGNLEQARELAVAALPHLAAALANSPQLPDVFPVHQVTEAVIALARLSSAVDGNEAVTALDWGQRAFGHSGLAAGLAEDAQLKSAATRIHQAVEEMLPALMQAAGQ